MSVNSTIDEFIHDRHERGATLEEIAEWSGFSPQRVGDALTELKTEGRIVRTPHERKTGLFASPVWRAA